SWPLTSSRLKSPSSSPAYGARLDRNRIQTDVSTKTIMPLRDRVLKPAHDAGEPRVRVARIRGARAAARTRRGEPAPRDQDEPYQCLSSHRRLTWRFVTAARRYGGSSSQFWFLVAGVRLPILSGGRIRANIQVQDARQEEAIRQYEKAVLIAVEDVENSLSSQMREQQRLEAL